MEIYHDAVRGLSYNAIAANRGISGTAVSKFVRQVEAYLWPIMSDDIRGTKVRQSDAHQLIFREAMEAWEASKKPIVELRQRVVDGVLETTKITRGQCGDPRHLDVAMRALAAIREIWGANAPVQVEHSGDIRVAGRSVEEARGQLLQQLSDVQKKILSQSTN
jgi:hypothetical protein